MVKRSVPTSRFSQPAEIYRALTWISQPGTPKQQQRVPSAMSSTGCMFRWSHKPPGTRVSGLVTMINMMLFTSWQFYFFSFISCQQKNIFWQSLWNPGAWWLKTSTKCDYKITVNRPAGRSPLSMLTIKTNQPFSTVSTWSNKSIDLLMVK